MVQDGDAQRCETADLLRLLAIVIVLPSDLLCAEGEKLQSNNPNAREHVHEVR